MPVNLVNDCEHRIAGEEFEECTRGIPPELVQDVYFKGVLRQLLNMIARLLHPAHTLRNAPGRPRVSIFLIECDFPESHFLFESWILPWPNDKSDFTLAK